MSRQVACSRASTVSLGSVTLSSRMRRARIRWCSPPAGGSALVSFAEHLHLAVGVVDIDGELIELLDEFLDVLRFELGEVDRYP
jgi:hypothetical protein